MRLHHATRWLLTLSLVVLAPTVSAQRKPTELSGAKDPALLSRYAGATLQNAASESFASVRIPAGPGRAGADGQLQFDQSSTVEGQVSAYFYILPKERTALEVYRNYQQALTQAGFASVYSCEMRACDQAMIRERFANEVVRPRPWRGRDDPASAIDRDVRFLSARATRHGAEVSVMVFVAEPDSVWQAPVAVVLIAEPAAMEAGKVLVGSEQLRKGLADEGRIALYGIYFDTGRAELRPDSKPQLEQMAQLLRADRALRVAIVGHTDNQGSVDGNLALSQRRAEAVVAALVGQHGIDAARLRARGVASFAPLASNRSDAGRARNRRVELIEQ